MKTAIVSCYFKHNYGSMLQAYATQMALDRLGIENETIDISGFDGELKKRKIKYFAKAALTSDILLSKFGMAKNVLMKRFSRTDYTENIKLRDRKFSDFASEKFRLSDRFSSIEELSLYTASHYNTVLVGSDQLWLPANIAADYYTLNWVPESINSVAYATSFGQSSLPKDAAEKAAVFLKKIRHIGVREESGQKLVKQLAGRDVPVVCDPTLLFTGDEWLEKIGYYRDWAFTGLSRKNCDVTYGDSPIKGQSPVKSYIFVYFLGNNPSHREFVKRLKKETGFRIIALTHLDEYIKSDEGYADETPYEVGPAEFITLIRNAAYVCTDSFHCSVFSMLFHKKFFAFRRYARKTASSTNSRLDTLFSKAGVEGQILSGEESISNCLNLPIYYDQVEENLSNFRGFSLDYLKSSLSES